MLIAPLNIALASHQSSTFSEFSLKFSTPGSSLHHTTHTDDNRIQSRSHSNSDPTDYSSDPTRSMLDTCACFDEPDFYFREYLGEVIKRILRRQENASHDDITDLLNDTSHIDYFDPADDDDDEDDDDDDDYYVDDA